MTEFSFKTPLSIYVIYHPDTQESRDLANSLHDWFRLSEDDSDNTETGLPIWFRARLNNSEEKPERIDPPIEWDKADLNVVVILVDDRMVSCQRWRQAIKSLLDDAKSASNETDCYLFLPVGVDQSVRQLAFLSGELSTIRIGNPRRDDEDENPSDKKEKEDRDKRIAKRARILRRSVTEAIIRELRNKRQGDPPLPIPLKIFLSHAKADGANIAETIRDSLASLSQLDFWYDANDLPPGYKWDSPMARAAEKNTAALIAIVSDAYPSRYWCRNEVTLARKPRCMEQIGRLPIVSAWTVQPTVAVHKARQWSRAMAQLTQVPRIGWPDDSAQFPDQVAKIIERLLLETLLITFYRRYMAKLAIWIEEKLKNTAHQEGKPKVVLLSWVPDAWSLMQTIASIRKRTDFSLGEQLIVAYPGHGLRTAEHQELCELLEAAFPEGDRTQVYLTSQERLREYLDMDPSRRVNQPLNLQILISGGGDDKELEATGVNMKHVNDLIIRLARRLLQRNCTLAYGGTFSQAYGMNLTQGLIDVALGWIRANENDSDAAQHSLENPPFKNYSAWPNYLNIPLRWKADLTGICEFIQIDPPNESSPQLSEEYDRHNPEHTRLGADALSEMRRKAASEVDVPIVMTGKIRGWAGWLPGIAEEVMYSLESNRLPLILGAFGGCAKEIADFLLHAENGEDPPSWPESLTFEAALKDKSFELLVNQPGNRRQAERHFNKLRQRLENFYEELRNTEKALPERFGRKISRDAFFKVMKSSDASSAIDAIIEALDES